MHKMSQCSISNFSDFSRKKPTLFACTKMYMHTTKTIILHPHPATPLRSDDLTSVVLKKCKTVRSIFDKTNHPIANLLCDCSFFVFFNQTHFQLQTLRKRGGVSSPGQSDVNLSYCMPEHYKRPPSVLTHNPAAQGLHMAQL